MVKSKVTLGWKTCVVPDTCFDCCLLQLKFCVAQDCGLQDTVNLPAQNWSGIANTESSFMLRNISPHSVVIRLKHPIP